MRSPAGVGDDVLRRACADVGEFEVVQLHGGLKHRGPRPTHVRDQREQIIDVTQQAETTHARALKKAGAHPRGIGEITHAIPRHRRRQHLDVTTRPAREQMARVADVGIRAVAVGEERERVGQMRFGGVDEAEVVPQRDHVAFAIRTAANLKCGCFETGSQPLSVSSFAARGRLGSSQVP